MLTNINCLRSNVRKMKNLTSKKAAGITVTKILALTACTLLILLNANTVGAQNTGEEVYDSARMAMATKNVETVAKLVLQKSVLGGNMGRTAASRGETTAVASAPTKINALTFRPTGNRLMLKDVVNALGQDATKRAAVETVILQGTNGFEEEMRKDGRANNLAVALTFFVVSNWSIATGEKVSDEASEVVFRQLQAQLNVPEINVLSDADKQKFYEYCVYLGIFVAVLNEASVGNDEMRAQVKAIAGNFWQTLIPVAPSSINIDSRGISASASPSAATAADNAAVSKKAAPPNPTAANVGGAKASLTFDSNGWKVAGNPNQAVTLTRTVPTVTGGLTTTVAILYGAARPGDPATHGAAFFEELIRPAIPADARVAPDSQPEVFRRYVGNGLRTAFSAVTYNRSVILNNGSQATRQEIHLYAIESGGQSIPVLVSLGGFEQRGTVAYPNIDGKVRNEWLEELLASMRGAPASAPLFTQTELAGDYTLNSGVAGLQYYSVTTGVYAGTAFVSRGAELTLRANGMYQAHFTAVSGVSTINSAYDSRENGKYLLTKDEYGAFLTLTDARPQHKMRLVGLIRMPTGGKVLMTIGNNGAPISVAAVADYVDRYINKPPGR